MNLKSELIQENDRIYQLVQTIKARYTITEELTPRCQQCKLRPCEICPHPVSTIRNLNAINPAFPPVEPHTPIKQISIPKLDSQTRVMK